MPPSLTPLMRQYTEIKKAYPDAILLFRVGDFYESFGKDAVRVASILQIVLTKRHPNAKEDEYLAGFPHHALDAYLHKLAQSGLRIAICEQMEEAKQAKGLVRREVTELITPGTLIYDRTLSGAAHNFLCAYVPTPTGIGLGFADISTGDFWVTEGHDAYADKLLQTLVPSEILISRKQVQKFKATYKEQFCVFLLEEWIMNETYARELLTDYFETHSLKGFGIENTPSIIIAAGMIIHYVKEIQKPVKNHFSSITKWEKNAYLWIDKFTIQHLDLLPTSPATRAHSLLGIMDKTKSPMGARLLKQWLLFPLNDANALRERLDTVEELITKIAVRASLRELLKECGDIERYITRTALKKTNPRELYKLGVALDTVLKIIEKWKELSSPYARSLAESLSLYVDIFQRLSQEILRTLLPEAPLKLNPKSPCIREGLHEELDSCRKMKADANTILMEIQNREAKKWDIPSLKIAYNNIFGYYIEVSNTHKNKVPSQWQRRQTLSNAERYTTEELKIYELQIQSAQARIALLEEEIFNALVEQVSAYIQPIQIGAHTVGVMDVLSTLALIAETNHYVRPRMHTDANERLVLRASRHPIIEQHVTPYISNDVFLDNETQQIILLTGPNMSGKSALLKQVALTLIMAHMGSFVPCQEAFIPITDKIFTRVGASDNMSAGESTFMVEMNETAMIVNNMGARTFMFLDEIGRGTSTYDGVAIAASVLTYLHEHASRPKVFFATHYHELSPLTKPHLRIRNFHIAYTENGAEIIFLRTLTEGASQKSFGIQVAKMAGLPLEIIHLAEKLLAHLESEHATPHTTQLPLLTKNDPYEGPYKSLCESIQTLETDKLSPLDALLFLVSLQAKTK